MARLSSEKVIKTIEGELDVPLFYSLPDMTRRLRMGSVSYSTVAERLSKRGFRVTRTQFSMDGIKTDASASEVGRVIKSLR